MSVNAAGVVRYLYGVPVGFLLLGAHLFLFDGTLSSITAGFMLQPSSVTLEQMLVALFRNNADAFDGNMNRGIPKNGHQIAMNAGRVPCLLTDMPRRCFGNSSPLPSTSNGGGVGTAISRSTLRKASETQLPSARPFRIYD